jgi:hypothetical protein
LGVAAACPPPPSFFYQRPPFGLFGLIIFSDRSSPMKTSLPLVELEHVNVCWERVFVELHLRTFCKFQSSFVYGRLNLSMENIAIISSMRIRIMPFTICMLFSCSNDGMT